MTNEEALRLLEELKSIRAEKRASGRPGKSVPAIPAVATEKEQTPLAPVHPADEVCYERQLSPLAAEVRHDIEQFIKGCRHLLFNEFDFQMQLCLYLRERKERGYEHVYAEYFMPLRHPQNRREMLSGYDWDSNMRVDIVVKRAGEYVPVELKYTTCSVVRDIDRFGKTFPNVEVLRHQGAADNIRYNCWKDVRRIELIKKIFDSVKSGLTVHLTCDSTYLKDPRQNSSNYPFSTSGTRPIGGGKMDWIGEPATRDKHMPFILEGVYRMSWHNINIDGVDFYYEILNI